MKVGTDPGFQVREAEISAKKKKKIQMRIHILLTHNQPIQIHKIIVF